MIADNPREDDDHKFGCQYRNQDQVQENEQ